MTRTQAEVSYLLAKRALDRERDAQVTRVIQRLQGTTPEPVSDGTYSGIARTSFTFWRDTPASSAVITDIGKKP